MLLLGLLGHQVATEALVGVRPAQGGGLVSAFDVFAAFAALAAIAALAVLTVHAVHVIGEVIVVVLLLLLVVGWGVVVALVVHKTHFQLMYYNCVDYKRL